MSRPYFKIGPPGPPSGPASNSSIGLPTAVCRLGRVQKAVLAPLTRPKSSYPPTIIFYLQETQSSVDKADVEPAQLRSTRAPELDVGVGVSTATPSWVCPTGGKAFQSPTRRRILFYHKVDPHYGFTNFSAHPVTHDKKRYATSEHLFQSFKFQQHRPDIAEHIRTCSERPSAALSEARRFQPEVRSDWKDVNIQMMDLVLWHKFTQHESLKNELLATGDAELIEDSDKDSFWGIGADRRGRNELGKALERLRAKLQDL
ncbi:hypothetical protein FB45DRAFT_874242 [Roridomyces roridus]|uniref:NADAR domain-containing protein n=1 Tax=Roridomyces roridus TaxID=1738132 RepID=A0AAD7B8X1_9AGAR|nr:hypothetical protein FB45DRAFT_874242 [Roridomyces roridus]